MRSFFRFFVGGLVIILGISAFIFRSAILNSDVASFAVFFSFIGAGLFLTLPTKSEQPSEILPEREPEVLYPEAEMSVSPQTNEVSESENLNEKVFVKLRDEIVFHRMCVDELSRSISDHLKTTTEPISAELLRIQETIATFLKKVREHDADVDSQKTLTWISAKNERVVADIEAVSNMTLENFRLFEKDFISIETVLQTVLQISTQIEEIFEKIHLLSINASIESARAGEAGKGFKVISNEIKGLSNETKGFIEQIHSTIEKASGIFSGIDADLSKKRVGFSKILESQKTNLADFSGAFTDHYRKFETLYANILDFISAISTEVTHLSPIVQLHEITTQELENLGAIDRDFLDDSQTLLDETLNADANSHEVASGAGDQTGESLERVRKRVTTARELDALQRVLQKAGRTDKADLRRNNTDIEFF